MLFKANKVTHLAGHGKITGANEVSVIGPDGSVQDVVQTKNIMIAMLLSTFLRQIEFSVFLKIEEPKWFQS